MDTENNGIIELELKYCERCGGLWLRIRGRDDVYCASCALQISDLPGAAVRKRGAKLRARRGDRKQLPNFANISRQGGNA
ncbi:MAG TPA: hypothetical protein VN684_05905 [Terriglobales bacterium]|nr:hypothetical protein [Terriglobales bacterium]